MEGSELSLWREGLSKAVMNGVWETRRMGCSGGRAMPRPKPQRFCVSAAFISSALTGLNSFVCCRHLFLFRPVFFQGKVSLCV